MDAITESQGYIDINGLEPSQKERFEELETQTDEIFNLRTRLARFNLTCRRYFPQTDEPRRGGNEGNGQELTTRHLRVDELYERKLQLGEGQDIEDLIDWEAVKNEFNKKFPQNSESNDTQRKIEWEVFKDEVIVDFDIGLSVYAALNDKKGYWQASDPSPDAQEIMGYYKMRWGEYKTAARFYDAYAAQKTAVVQRIEYIQNELHQNKGRREIKLGALNRAVGSLAELESKYHGYVEDHPEAYYFVKARELMEAKEVFDSNGKIIETPYVQLKIEKIVSDVRAGRPVFIVGELGSGKTELAIHISTSRLSEAHVRRWEQEHPSPEREWEKRNPKPEKSEDLKQSETWLANNPYDDGMDRIRISELIAHDRDVKDWEHRREAQVGSQQRLWESQREKEKQPLFLAGHRNLDADNLESRREIRRTEPTPPEEQLNIISERWQEYNARRIAQGSEVQISKDDFFQAYRQVFESTIETKEVLGVIRQAQKEGRPVIIDELNSIPHYTLIVLNDMLMRRPGDWVTSPIDGQRYQVQEGFAIFGTGNYKPEDGKMYQGRQTVDAAFLSRWELVEYDYLPMNRMAEDPSLTPDVQRKFRTQNELYQMIVARLVDDDLSVTLPDNALMNGDMPGQLYRLAMVARNIQDIFSQKEVNSAYDKVKINNADVSTGEALKENVLSIRHLLPILDKWKTEGFTKPLDYYLFDMYIRRSSVRPNEMKVIYNLLQTQGGFFDPREGWPSADQESQVRNFNIDALMRGEKRYASVVTEGASVRTYSAIEVVNDLYGPPDARRLIPNSFFETKSRVENSDDTDDTDTIDLAEARRIQEEKAFLKRAVEKLISRGYPLNLDTNG